jgi:hypothetical protein
MHSERADMNVADSLALPYTIEVLHDPSGEQAGWFARAAARPRLPAAPKPEYTP